MSDSHGSKTGRDWLLVLGVLIGILAVIAVAGTGWHAIVKLSEYSETYEQNTRQIERKANQAINQGCSFLRFDAKNECISQAQEAAQDKERNESDLYAQRQMAVWAFSVGIAGFISVFLSLAGIFYVWYSLALNRAAVDAAVSANANTLTAIDQDQQNAERQTRAYLTVDSVNSDWDKEFAYRNGFKVKIRNCGQTPAYGIVAGSTVDYRPVGKFSFVSPAQGGAPPVAMLGAGSVMTLDVKELPEITPELQKELLARKMEIAVSGKIEYVDLFNKKRWITFNYAITGNYHHPPSGDVFYPCKIGNEASEPEKKAEHSGSPTSPFPPS